MDKNKISNHFTWKEALFLPQYNREANETDGLTPIIKANLVVLFSKMDTIREHFNKPINVHIAFRSEAYNTLIGGAKHSAHLQGMACDFDVSGMTCDSVRDDIEKNKLLDTLGMRMEKKPGSNWVHLDFAQVPPGGNRYFLP
jgi:zinc D-Ala-D-Ala carboxypeptidase